VRTAFLLAIPLVACASQTPSDPPARIASRQQIPVRVDSPAHEAEAFAWSDARDPFQPPGPSIGLAPVAPQWVTKARRFSLDELRLVGIVTGDDSPRAMLVDPRGKGWVVGRGDHVGRPEGSACLAAWRVDRIRDSDVVLVCEHPAGSEGAPETRSLALRADVGPPDLDD